MKIVIILITALTVVACGTTQVLVSPAFIEKSNEYKVTEKPGVFSGEKLTFGPYQATKIKRKFATKSGIGIGKFSASDTKQDFTYTFKGKGNVTWNGKCDVEKDTYGFSAISTANGWTMNCIYSSKGMRTWKFTYKSSPQKSGSQFIKYGKNSYKIVSKDVFGGATVAGYHFYAGKKMIAAVSSVNSAGPVWFNKKLSTNLTDRFGLIMTALMLNQVN